MKKFILRTLLVLLILFVAAGAWQLLTYESSTNQLRIQVAAPIEKTYTFLVKPDKLKRWIGGFKRSEMITEGGMKVGAKSRDIIEVDGQEYALESEITGYDPPHMMSIKMKHEGFVSEATYQLSENNGTTTIELDQQTRYQTTLGKLVAPLITFAAQEKLRQDFSRLKKLLEKQPATKEAQPQNNQPEKEAANDK